MTKWDIDSVNKFVIDNSECKLVSKEFKNATEKLIFECSCGNLFETTFKEFKGRKDRNYFKRQCNECGIKIRIRKRSKTNEQFIKEVSEIANNEYLVKSKYINSSEKILLKHKLCGNEFYMSPRDFVSNSQRCPRCFGTPKKSTMQFKEEAKVLYGDEYEVIGEYEGNKIKILIKHNLCNHIWGVTPNHFLRGSGCPKCSVVSKGENKIREYLISKNVEFIEQYRFKNCRNKAPLPFDFAIFKDEKLTLLIEYQGEQHYKPTRRRNANEKFAKIVTNDNIKKNYCITNKINLVIIPYTEFNNIENILKNAL